MDIPDLSRLDNEELFVLRAKLDAEFSKRGVSSNVGDLGEKLAITHFNMTPGLPNLLKASTGSKNVDALSRDGDRYSIKAYQKAKKTGTVYPDSNNKDKQLFEYLLVVQLDENYKLKALYRYSWKQFIAIRAWDKRMNAWYIPLSNKSLQIAESIYHQQSSKFAWEKC